jgi:hypothetical protein
MSYDTKMDTITVNGITYDIETETSHSGMGEKLTLARDGEEVFEGIEGYLGYDDDASMHNPREWSNVGTMAVHYSGYDLGDEDIEKIDFEVQCPACEGECEDPNDNWVVGIHHAAEHLAVGSQEDCEEYLETLPEVESGRYYIEPMGCARCESEGYVQVNPVDYFKRERKARVVLPVCVYEHSGMTMYVGAKGDYPFDSAGWDTSFVGFIFDTPEGVEQCIGKNVSDEAIESALISEVKVYASYLEGDITYWSVSDDESEFYDGCGGFVGDHEECKAQCYAGLESAIIARLAENKEREEMAARDINTI